MFCMNCGQQIPNNSKFCMSCGVPVGSTQTGSSSSSQAINTNTHNNISQPIRVQNLLYRYFGDTSEYGSKLILIGHTPMTQNMKSNINKYCNGELPLMAFNYENDLEKGFILTENSFIFNYASNKKRYKFNIHDIESIKIGKAILADVMTLYTFDRVKSEYVYLTGIKNVPLFGIKFQNFLTDLNSIKADTPQIHHDIDNMSTDDFIEFIEDLIGKVILKLPINSTYCEVSNPIPRTSRKYKKAMLNFAIEPNENLFLIYDATVFGGCEKGFAICSSGIYLCAETNQPTYIGWDKFLNINISIGFTNLKIGPFTFNGGTSDGKKLYAILCELQEQLNSLC